jgi:hypothetical protein
MKQLSKLSRGFGVLMTMAVVGGAVSAVAPLAQRAAAPVAPAIIRIVARDYWFELPPRWPSGIVRLRLVNRGAEAHYALLYRLGAGKAARDFFAWRASGSPAPEWLTVASGPGPVIPGDSTDVTLRLATGHYLVLCGYPGRGGTQHVDNGMFRVFDVRPPRARSSARAVYPVADRTLRMTNSAFALDRTVPPGWRAIHIENRGSAPEQALIVRLPEGVAVADEQRWFDEGFRSPRPGLPWGGALRVAPGERYVVTRFFPPGRYVVLSHLTGTWRSLVFVVGR